MYVVLSSIVVLLGAFVYPGYALPAIHSISRYIILRFFRKHKTCIHFIDSRKMVTTPTGTKENNSHSTIFVYDSSWYSSLAMSPSVAFGDGYAEKRWDTPCLLTLLSSLIRDEGVRSSSGTAFYRYARFYGSMIMNAQSLVRAKSNVASHYDVGNDLYAAMLDPLLQYSCGWWPEGITTLADAQIRKIRVTLAKLELCPGMRLLDIGCGWGGLMHYAKKTYGVEVVGLTLSKEQVTYGKSRFPEVNFILEDYRTFCPRHAGEFDRVVSVGMFEHVGSRNYRDYFSCVRQVLRADTGIFLLHTIASNRSDAGVNEWIEKRVFPGGELPSPAMIARESERLFVVEDLQNVGPYYAKTLAAWREKAQAFFSSLDKDGKIDRNSKYNETFRRMWIFYLTSCEAAFNARVINLLQVVLTPRGHMDNDGNGKVLSRYDGIPIANDDESMPELIHT